MKRLILLLLAAPLGYLLASLNLPVGSTGAEGVHASGIVLIFIGATAALMHVKFSSQTVSNRLSEEEGSPMILGLRYLAYQNALDGKGAVRSPG